MGINIQVATFSSSVATSRRWRDGSPAPSCLECCSQFSETFVSVVRLQILAGCNTQPSRTKRQNPRYSIRGEFKGTELPAFQARQKPAVFRGRVKDISDGGFCLLAPGDLSSPFFSRVCPDLLRWL